MSDDRDTLAPATHGRSLRWQLGGLAMLLLAVAFSTALRIQVTQSDPFFDRETPAGLLRSDQGLIYYVTELIADADGGTPDDFRSDPRICHPDTADIPAMFSVGQEFLIAWTYLALGKEYALHVVALWLMSFIASLVLVGVYGLAYELTRKPGWAGLAALFFAVLPINYRTMGIILLREDLSVPLFALHLWLTARAVRRDSTGAWVGSGLMLSAALATWHAMTFVVAIEVVTLLAWFVRTGSNPLARARAWIVPAILVLAGLTIPMLRSKLFLLSPTMAVVFGMAVHALIWRRSEEPSGTNMKRIVTGVACVLVVGVLTQFAARMLRGGEGDYAHVLAFLWAKITGLGARPSDPTELPFGARLLWQGAFSTATPIEFAIGLGLALIALTLGLIKAAPIWLRGASEQQPDRRGFALLGGFMGISIVSAWMVRRTMILLGMGAPILALWPFLKPGRGRTGALVLSAAILGQGGFILYSVSTTLIPWYRPVYQPVDYPREIRHLVEWVDGNIDPSRALLADFSTSTSVLAHSRNPIVTQPKYETTESRERIEQFFTTFFKGSLGDLNAMMDRYETDYLLLDCWQLAASLFVAGLPPGSRGPQPGTPASLFLRRDPTALRSIPGFRIIYATPPGLGRGSFRIFKRVRKR
ncbi:MAG: hypothetical protein ACI8QZ_003950 [Chlamydiales bacterium]